MEKTLKDYAVQESEVISKQSLEGLYITGYEWSDYVESESDVITYFVSKGIIPKPVGDYNEDVIIDDIVTNHKEEYLKYLEELRQIYELYDSVYSID